MKFFIALMLMSCSVFADVKVNFSAEQLDNLNYAYQFGEQYNKDGSEKTYENRYNDQGLGYIFAAMAWLESSAYEDPRKIAKKKKGHHAYGLFQNYLPTVRNRSKQMGLNLTDEQIINQLVIRHKAAEWSYIELNNWLKVHKGDLKRALASYNGGYRWHKPAPMYYSQDILRKAEYLKRNKILSSPTE